MCRFWAKSSKGSRTEELGPRIHASTANSPVNTSRSRSVTPTSPTSPTTNPRIDQPKDDASIIRLFSLIDNSITDHVLNYYISPKNGSERFSHFGKDNKQLEWVLRAAPSSLREARTQVIIIRAIIGYEIFRAIQNDYFIPLASKKVLAEKRYPADLKWRQNHFQSLANSQKYHQHRENAIDALANNILQLTQPLVASTDRVQEITRLKSLKAIAENAADFALTVGKQKPNFKIHFPRVSSAASRANSASSRPARATQRKRNSEELDIPVLIPELRKYGDESGKNYDQFIILVPVQRLPEFS